MRETVLIVSAMIAALVGSCARPEGSATSSPSGRVPDGRCAVLYPPDGTVTAADKLTVIAVVPAAMVPPLLLDGTPVEARRMAFSRQFIEEGRLFPTSRPATDHPLDSPLLRDKTGNVLLVAQVSVKPGQRVVEVGGRRAVWRRLASNPAPEGIFREHGTGRGKAPMTECRFCHEMEEAGPNTALGVAQPPAACQKCHNEDELDLAHKHKMDSLSRCHLCHDPHGSARPYLLINERDKLCALCHEAGHYKK